MAKRGPVRNLAGEGPSKKKVTQQSLKRFFKSVQEGNQSTPSTSPTVATPQYYGVHIYTETEISSAVGLQKEFRIFWNEKAKEVCAEKSVRAYLGNKAAIQGTIYSSWTLHKTHLLRLQVEELQEEAKKICHDEVALARDFTNVNKNLERMLQTYAYVTGLDDHIKSLNKAEKMTKEEEFEVEMTELKRAQNSLHQALERRRVEMLATKKDIEEEKVLIASPPVTLSSDEMEELIQTVRNEDD